MLFSHMLHSLDFSPVSSATYDYDLLIHGFYFSLPCRNLNVFSKDLILCTLP